MLDVLTLALCDDHQPTLAAVLLGQHGQLQSNLAHIGSAEVVLLSVGSSLGLVAEYDVSEGEDRGHLVFKELAEERSREVETVGLVVLSAVLRHLQHGVHGDREEKSSGVNNSREVRYLVKSAQGDTNSLGGLHQLPVGLLLQVGDSEVVGGVQLGHEGPVLVGDQDGAPSGGLLADLVPHVHPGLPGLLLQDLPGAVLAHTAHVGGEIFLTQHPLSNSRAGGVLTKDRIVIVLYRIEF